ncbi:MAG: enoyl-CoA hydratase/isomerase family protein [Blastocatellia bacterium]|nr:enoyl-CoA hydratase/isomerase family protein [Blastocatellia bacterium]
MSITYQKDDDNIVTLTIDMPNRSANVINYEFGEAFQSAMTKLEAETDLRGILVTSAKKTFLAGGDLDLLFAVTDAAEAMRGVDQLKVLFRKLETMGKPVVACLNGSALGGGCELALACHRRIALKAKGSEIGMPEVTLGLLPGAGGVTRTVRLLGFEKAFPFLMEGKRVSPEEAFEAGLVSELADSPEEMMVRARMWIFDNPDAIQPWDRSDYRMRGGDPRNPKTAQMLSIAPAMLLKKTHGNYPAPLAIMSAAVEGAVVDFETASRIESRYFAQVATSQTAKNMISAFWFQLNAINEGKSRPGGFPPAKFHKVGILGAGMMGSGIAYATALSGIEVVLKDVSLEAAERGKSYSEKLLAKRVSSGKMDEEKMRSMLDRITPTDSAEDLKGCDLIIEAVFENRELKARVTQEAEAQLAPDAIFASNTSTLPITGLATASARPENFIGLHFFSPVDKMQLVEIIVGEKTSDETLARGFDYVRQIRKIPIVVNDSRGFYTSRVFGTYVSEGMALLAEGQHPKAIESAGIQAGMPVGPLAVSDEVSMSLMLHIRTQTRKDMEAEGKPFPEHPSNTVIERMVNGHDRPGKAAGKGFYEYPKGGKKYLWPELTKLFPPQSEKLSLAEMMERLQFIQVLETARCFEENVVRSVPDANIGSIFGWGFAPFKGGTLQFINDYGIAKFVARARELAAKYGERFEPPALLVTMAEKDESFS